MKVMVLKNLTAHRGRNSLTSVIYSLALGFVIFLIIAYKIQIETLRLHELRFRAGYLQVQVEHNQPQLNPKLLEPIFKQQTIIDQTTNYIGDYIQEFSWIPRELSVIPHLKVVETKLSNYAFSVDDRVGSYGVLPSLFKSTHTELLEVAYQNPDSGLSILE